MPTTTISSLNASFPMTSSPKNSIRPTFLKLIVLAENFATGIDEASRQIKSQFFQPEDNVHNICTGSLFEGEKVRDRCEYSVLKRFIAFTFMGWSRTEQSESMEKEWSVPVPKTDLSRADLKMKLGDKVL
ncbi:hypothetical protein BOTNAR_0235g00190 [Botryotinia narcissicola]|uniref:Uncharacterized protein n=1 Tax=Botryotinia narcissicola TaxID=278944 RepID=A0A4Z1I3L7_9HELO|nr:hypothetical protein BOTNAR_0235g00190 [Botryotinia narcissicola]